jgi:hypothetical protein
MVNALLVIDNILLGQYVKNLPVEGKGDSFRRIQNSCDIRLRDLATLYGDHPVAVQALDVRSRNACENRRDIASRHEFGFFDRFFYGMDRLIDVYDDSAPKPG